MARASQNERTVSFLLRPFFSKKSFSPERESDPPGRDARRLQNGLPKQGGARSGRTLCSFPPCRLVGFPLDLSLIISLLSMLYTYMYCHCRSPPSSPPTLTTHRLQIFQIFISHTSNVKTRSGNSVQFVARNTFWVQHGVLTFLGAAWRGQGRATGSY